MMSRKRSVFRLLIPAAIVGGLLWWAKLWPFSRGTSPPPARIPNVADAARQAYERLGETFRERVPLGDFAGMYEKMADRDTGARPRIRNASVTGVTEPGSPVLPFGVGYPYCGSAVPPVAVLPENVPLPLMTMLAPLRTNTAPPKPAPAPAM